MPSRIYSTLFSLDSSYLQTEAQVETRFVAPLLKELDYPAEAILPKEHVPKLIGDEGSQRRQLEIDFLLHDPDGFASVIVEAKAPTEDVSAHWGQAASYALSHNRSLSVGEKSIEWILITNGLITALYRHDRDTPIVTLRLVDFSSGSPPFVTLKNYLRYKTRQSRQTDETIFDTIPPGALNTLFTECHNLIWKKQRLSPTEAFYEFCKFIFIKIREDKKRQKLDASIPRHAIPLTMAWLQNSRPTSKHPVRDILFVQLRDELDQSIKHGKKRIYDRNEELKLTESTCKELIRRFENINLSAIDEDLNGRMFEQFLNEAVRGKELGQYFTPRPVVDFMTRVALHGCDMVHPPRVLDACAGTGGFLIEILAYLLAAARNDTRLTNTQKEAFMRKVCNEHLFGVEGSETVSRVARINMHLHGDGGSHIFYGDGLDSDPQPTDDMSDERKNEVTEHAQTIIPDSFDLVLTNPPFSMSYETANDDENRILKQRDIATGLNQAKSNVLFLDRYHELLKPGGEFLIVLDDTVLNGKMQINVRKWVMRNFIILGIHSLPFNAFFKAKANIKTSILHLRKKQSQEEQQGHVFMSISNNIGHDNHVKDTLERNNLVDVLMLYFEWKRTGTLANTTRENQDCSETLECPQQVWLQSPDTLTVARFDSFYYSPDLKKVREELQRKARRGDIQIQYGKEFKKVPKLSKETRESLRAQGTCLKYIEIGDVTPYGLIVHHLEGTLDDLPSRGHYQVRTGDILMAINNSSRGTVVWVPEAYDGTICTSGFLVIRPKSREEGYLLWYALRSEYARSQNYYLAQTASQPELKEEAWNHEFMIPMPSGRLRKKALDQARTFLGHVSALHEAARIRLE